MKRWRNIQRARHFRERNNSETPTRTCEAPKRWPRSYLVRIALNYEDLPDHYLNHYGDNNHV